MAVKWFRVACYVNDQPASVQNKKRSKQNRTSSLCIFWGADHYKCVMLKK